MAARTALSRNQPQETRTTVAPVAVPAHSCAESTSPATAEVTLTRIDHQNMPPAVRARLRAVAAGTMSSAVTKRTPTAQTENITTSASSPAKRYCQKKTLMRWALATTEFRPMYNRRL